MNRFEKRKLKQNIYKNANTMMYILIFAIASVITILAAVQRDDDIAYVDEKQLAASSTEAIEIANGESVKVAAKEETVETTEAAKLPETTEEPTEEETKTEAATEKEVPTLSQKIRITADTLTVRSDASQDAESLGLVDEGDVFEILSVKNEWIQISFEGQTGYVNAEFVELVME
ncbi:MAG: SH3 domain-containing protein [Eubacterium sp.]|nr:SH3 domain-containing protein [Eubacterium sp.]